MTRSPIRRKQLIAPFGVGCMTFAPDGTAVIVAGLDHWYERLDEEIVNPQGIEDDFVTEEWRLERMLEVDHFREPPDFRDARFSSPDEENQKLVVPCLRFPKWHVCPNGSCRALREIPLHTKGRVKCRPCQAKGWTNYMAQVTFVAICKYGHIQDFPWVEWVHYSANPSCEGRLTLKATGGASLSGQRVSCECGASRSLSGITNFERGFSKTSLSDNLERGEDGFFSCQGASPWLGIEENKGVSCDSPLKGSLINASNVYLALQASSIYVPQPGTDDAPEELIELLKSGVAFNMIRYAEMCGEQVPAQTLRDKDKEEGDGRLNDFSLEQIEAALAERSSTKKGEKEKPVAIEGEDTWTDFRRPEFFTFLSGKKTADLSTEAFEVSAYEEPVNGGRMDEIFSKVVLLHKLRETRAFAGFGRCVGLDEPLDIEKRNELLWVRPPSSSKSWLPAYIVRGEGILLEFEGERLREWENREKVVSRLKRLNRFHEEACAARGSNYDEISPRFLLLHTISHLLINQLIYDCGYGAASLQERLYVSADVKQPMAGVLIYTAAGDVDGTLGGLVRLGKPGYLEHVINRALERSQWCSNDPICMEIGSKSGQGSGACNLAACHSCALLPETSCEKFNRFLDRAVVIGDPTDETNSIGFFT